MSQASVSASLKALEPTKQEAFKAFYRHRVDARLRPLLLDFTLVMICLDALVNLFGQYGAEAGWSSVHVLAYVYGLAAFGFLIGHRVSAFRSKPTMMLYGLYVMLALFACRDFIVHQGWIAPLTGLFLFLGFVGHLSFSLKHTLVILSMNALLLALCFQQVYAQEDWVHHYLELFASKYVITCMASACAAAVFVKWIFRYVYATQFLLNEKNEKLLSTLALLKVTEDNLIQQQKYQALNHMAKGLLHEIINPVNSSAQALQFARSVNHDADIDEALEEALVQHKRINDIIGDLRRFAEPDSQRQLEEVAVDSLIKQAIKFCQREIKKSHIHIELSVHDALCVKGQPSALVQVFVNIILNACDALKHLRQDTPARIQISSTEQSEQLIVTIKDNGVGIEAAELKRIMDPFVSSHQSPENMGLGLSICQTIMRHHNGAMEIKSEPNRWTEVSLSFPSAITVPAKPSEKVSAAVKNAHHIRSVQN